MEPMNEDPFETVLGERVEAVLDACTRCGKCVEVCPSVEPAGISDTKSEHIIGGILELVRTGNGPEASRKWAQSCGAERGVHQGVRLRRQSAFLACHGAAWHREVGP